MIPSERSVPGGYEQDGRTGECPDSQIGQCGVAELSISTHGGDDRAGERLQRQNRDHSGEDGHHEGLNDHAARCLPIAAAHGAGDHRRRAIREEVEQHEGHREDGRVDAQCSQWHHAKAPDEDGVHDRHEGVGRQRAERRQRETDDLAVQAAPGGLRGKCVHGDEDGRDPFVAKCPHVGQFATLRSPRRSTCQGVRTPIRGSVQLPAERVPEK